MFHDLRDYNFIIGFQATTFLNMKCISSLKKLLVIVACSKNERRKKEVVSSVEWCLWQTEIFCQ